MISGHRIYFVQVSDLIIDILLIQLIRSSTLLSYMQYNENVTL